jgi:hypothetical protein
MKKNRDRPSKIERNIKTDIFELLNAKKYDIIDSAYPAERIAGLIDAYCHARSATVKAYKQFVTMWIDSQNLEIEY